VTNRRFFDFSGFLHYVGQDEIQDRTGQDRTGQDSMDLGTGHERNRRFFNLSDFSHYVFLNVFL